MGMMLSAEEREIKRGYQRAYRKRHRDEINARRRAWGRNIPEAIRKYNSRYREKVAPNRRNLRASYEDYGITPERLKELQEIARSEEHASMVFSAARAADEKAARHILLSAIQGVVYEYLEFHENLGRCPLGRTDFYGARRLFYHNLDCLLKAEQEKGGNG